LPSLLNQKPCGFCPFELPSGFQSHGRVHVHVSPLAVEFARKGLVGLARFNDVGHQARRKGLQNQNIICLLPLTCGWTSSFYPSSASPPVVQKFPRLNTQNLPFRWIVVPFVDIFFYKTILAKIN
jgi:hypothetical protein